MEGYLFVELNAVDEAVFYRHIMKCMHNFVLKLPCHARDQGPRSFDVALVYRGAKVAADTLVVDRESFCFTTCVSLSFCDC